MVSFRNVANQRAGYHDCPGTMRTSNDGEKERITNKKIIQKNSYHHDQEGTIKMVVYILRVWVFFFHSQTQISRNSAVEVVFRPSCFIQPLTRNTFSPQDIQEQEALLWLHSVSSEFSKIKLTKAHRKMGWPRIPSFGQVGLKAWSSCDLGQ